jgi:hypothetical protein
MFEPLEKGEYNYHVAEWFQDTHAQLVEVVKNYIDKTKR